MVGWVKIDGGVEGVPKLTKFAASALLVHILQKECSTYRSSATHKDNNLNFKLLSVMFPKEEIQKIKTLISLFLHPFCPPCL